MQPRQLALLLALYASAAVPTMAARPSPTPYDGCGFLVQGVDCVLYQADNTNLYQLIGGNGGFQVGDYIHVVGEEGPCFSLCTYTGGCIFTITLIESCQSDPTTNFCGADGSAGACPCGNQGTLESGCSNSSGLGGHLAAAGTDSVTSNDLALFASQLPPNKPALLFTGTSNIGSGVFLGDGLRCAGGAIVRLGVQSSDGQGTASWAAGMSAIAGWQAGDTPHLQVWYRDVLNSPCGNAFNLTNGRFVTLTP